VYVRWGQSSSEHLMSIRFRAMPGALASANSACIGSFAQESRSFTLVDGAAFLRSELRPRFPT
jgi:hypothetical protein